MMLSIYQKLLELTTYEQPQLRRALLYNLRIWGFLRLANYTPHDSTRYKYYVTYGFVFSSSS